MWTGIFCGVAAGACWGLVFLLPRVLDNVTPLWLMLGRYWAYGVISLGLALPVWRSFICQLNRQDWRALLMLSLMGNLLYYWFMAVAVQWAGVAPASLIVGVLPISVTLVAAWVENRAKNEVENRFENKVENRVENKAENKNKSDAQNKPDAEKPRARTFSASQPFFASPFFSSLFVSSLFFPLLLIALGIALINLQIFLPASLLSQPAHSPQHSLLENCWGCSPPWLRLPVGLILRSSIRFICSATRTSIAITGTAQPGSPRAC